MILLFAGIVAGIFIGIVWSAITIAWWEMQEDEPADGDLSEFITKITPVETPFMSEMTRHREKHLAARGGDFDGTGSGLHRSGTERSNPSLARTDTAGKV